VDTIRALSNTTGLGLLFVLAGLAVLSFVIAYWPGRSARHAARRRPFAVHVTGDEGNGGNALPAAVMADDEWLDDNRAHIGRDPQFEALFWGLIAAHQWDDKRLATPDDLDGVQR
jgi:hypothetical protein